MKITTTARPVTSACSMLRNVAMIVFLHSALVSAQPAALPQNASPSQIKWQPATDYDTDGCYPTAAVGADGVAAGGLKTTGALNGHCRDDWDLDNTNSYVRTKCNGDYCAHVYAYYFEKDQTTSIGCSICGHRHDFEHVIIWEARLNFLGSGIRVPLYVSASAHGGFETRSVADVQKDNVFHPKIVYHKDGVSTHAFRFAGEGDEPPENHYGKWQYPALLDWNRMTSQMRNTLSTHDYGKAVFGISDGAFGFTLAAGKPEGIKFDPFQQPQKFQQVV